MLFNGFPVPAQQSQKLQYKEVALELQGTLGSLDSVYVIICVSTSNLYVLLSSTVVWEGNSN